MSKGSDIRNLKNKIAEINDEINKNRRNNESTKKINNLELIKLEYEDKLAEILYK